MRRSLPVILCSTIGVLMLLQYFIPHQLSQAFFERTLKMNQIIAIFALMVALVSVPRNHIRRIRVRGENWQYSIILLVGFSLLPIAAIIDNGLGFFTGKIKIDGLVFDWIYVNVQIPLGNTVFAMLAFYITSAAYRAFRARTFDAAILLTAGIIVLLANAPPTDMYIWSNFSSIRNWILETPSGAAQRALLLGLGLGAVSQSLRILLGIDRSWLGG
ncbi:TPA: hypothetical protein EYN98_18115 [Candidatus Poribacteria bacterium]|nr:hypothetical protein [Candidatus Poribacteria bacterium]HIB90448.1 hypothetical protein [Candidatus Poribacteria bacterium]HIC01131.1 hypothetical protein [Candidatus Poribacteria bacterium]HIM10106.1 hypothetical protein [Candidatus Poribacteria bacterium]HIN27825.1 hypothetical protein [Candidatus Poribacteria bacterium]